MGVQLSGAAPPVAVTANEKATPCRASNPLAGQSAVILSGALVTTIVQL